MIELSNKLKKWIKIIPMDILIELWEISQDHCYGTSYCIEDFGKKWNLSDEFWRQISYTYREGNNAL